MACTPMMEKMKISVFGGYEMLINPLPLYALVGASIVFVFDHQKDRLAIGDFLRFFRWGIYYATLFPSYL